MAVLNEDMVDIQLTLSYNKLCLLNSALHVAMVVHTHTHTHTHTQAVIPPLTPQTPLTPDSISPHHSLSAFTYPPAPPNFEGMQIISTQPSVSSIVTYQHNPAYGSPTDTLAHFDVNVDYSSPNLVSVSASVCVCVCTSSKIILVYERVLDLFRYSNRSAIPLYIRNSYDQDRALTFALLMSRLHMHE